MWFSSTSPPPERDTISFARPTASRWVFAWALARRAPGFFTGLRRNEIATAEWSRFDRHMEWYTVLGKNNLEARIPVHAAIKRHLEDRVSVYRYVFPGARKNHVHAATIGDWVRRVGDEAGIADLAPHQLRHTAISTINDTTGDLRATQEFARHASPETTRSYTRVTVDRLVAAVNTLDFLEESP